MGDKSLISKKADKPDGGLLTLPEEIKIEITNKCNLNCKFCFNSKRGKKELTTKEIYSIIDDIKLSGIHAIRLTGGEPFIRQDLIRILKYAKENRIYTILNTNGRLINEKIIHTLSYVDDLLISVHDLRNPQFFSKLFEEIKKYKNNIFLRCCTIASKENIRVIDKYYAFFEEQNIDDWFLLRPISEKIGLKKKDVGPLVENILKCNGKYKINTNIANSVPFCSYEGGAVSKVCVGGRFDSGRTRIVVDCLGNYKTDYFSAVIGNIKNQKILDIWNSKMLRDIRANRILPAECMGCYYSKKCNGGLMENENLRNPQNVKFLSSVIIPTFNNPKRLSLLIHSLENQTCRNFEVIVVDDGSTDNTKQVFNSLKNKSNLELRYFYLPNKKIFGAGIARNYGAKKARGNILIFLDQDNVASQNLVESHIREQEKNDIVLGYYSGYGNLKYHYKFDKLEEHIEKKKVIKTCIPEFREHIFQNPGQYAGDEWKYFVSANFSIKGRLFLEYLFDERFTKWTAEDIELGYRLVKDNLKIKFSRSCISYNSSEERMINNAKFMSLIPSLIQFYNKYKTAELKEYCYERFRYIPLELKGDAEIIEKTGELIFKKPTIISIK
ncbi:MAG: glycosyltransferase [Nanoarchaeota archaeon]